MRSHFKIAIQSETEKPLNEMSAHVPRCRSCDHDGDVVPRHPLQKQKQEEVVSF
jgi:hypothetical protein